MRAGLSCLSLLASVLWLGACAQGGSATPDGDPGDPNPDAAQPGPDARVDASALPDANTTPDALVCGGGLEECEGSCVDTTSDESNCGECGITCGTPDHGTAACESSACVVTCDGGFDDCNDDERDGCETAITGGDEANCGGCDIVCGAGQACNVDTCADTDAAPMVMMTSTTALARANGSFTVTFSEPVAWTGALTIDCLGPDPTATMVTTADDITFTVSLTAALVYNSTCAVTIPAAAVTDLDDDDALYDAMAANAALTQRVVPLAEDFQNTAGTAQKRDLPAEWIIQNVDGRTPHPDVAYVDAAWIVFYDFLFDENNFGLLSTSYYSPSGTANDWAFTPPVAISAGCTLTWRGLAWDADFRDGYQLKFCTTPTAASCTGNANLFSTSAESSTWRSRSQDLSSVAGQVGHLAFRNNSNDDFKLQIDDVVVTCP